MKNVAVFLDLTKIDDNILNYVREMDHLLHFETLTLIHYIELQDYTDVFSSHFPDLDRPLDEILHDEMKERAQAAGLDEKRIQITIHQKGGYEDLIQWVDSSAFDFCVFGKKVIYNGTGVFSGKVSRLISKSALFISETSRPQWEKVLVPIDYSDYSEKSLKLACDFAKNLNIEVIALHVFQVPPSYFPIIKEQSEPVIKEVRSKAEKRIREYAKKIGLPDTLSVDLIYAEGKTIANCIYDYSRSHYIDLIMMGFKGKEDDDSFLIGSVAERLIQSDRDLPVFLVRA